MREPSGRGDGGAQVRRPRSAARRGALTHPLASKRIVVYANNMRGLGPPPVSEDSIIDRWARLVVELVDAHTDPRTFEHWAGHVHLSVGTLREVCRAARVRGKRSLDLARLLRAVVWLHGRTWIPEAVLSCSDARTLRTLFLRTGCGDGSQPLRAEDFLARQTILDPQGPHILAIRRSLSRKTDINSGTSAVAVQ